MSPADVGCFIAAALLSAWSVYQLLGAGLTDGQELAGLVGLALGGVCSVAVASLAWWWPSGQRAPLEVNPSGFRVGWPRAHGAEVTLVAAGLGYVTGGVVQALRVLPFLDAIGFSGAGAGIVAGLVFAFAVPLRNRLPRVEVALEGRVLTVGRARVDLDDPAAQVALGRDGAGPFVRVSGQGASVRIRGHAETLREIATLVRALGPRDGRPDDVPRELSALRTE